MAVSISDEDFEFMYRTFERLQEIGLNPDDVVEFVKAERAIWRLLQRLAIESGLVEESPADMPAPSAPHPSGALPH